MSVKKFSVLLFIVLVTVVSNSFAVTQYVGDVDGFGFGAALGLVNVNGDPADMNGNGILDAGDAMPDLNKNGKLDLTPYVVPSIIRELSLSHIHRG